MADMLQPVAMGASQGYECKPEDVNQQPATVDMTSPITWAAVPGDLGTLFPDPNGDPLKTGWTRTAEGEVTLSCSFDADRGQGVPSDVIVTGVIPANAPSAVGGHISEVTL